MGSKSSVLSTDVEVTSRTGLTGGYVSTMSGTTLVVAMVVAMLAGFLIDFWIIHLDAAVSMS